MGSKMWVVAVLVAVGLGLVGCNNNADYKDREAVNRQQRQYAAAQPIPTFDWSLERDTAIQIYRIRNEKVRTWTVWRSDTGVIEGHCESIGFPLPYDVQLTNPLQPAHSGGGGGIVEQAEPNGLFSSKHTTATWVRSVIRDGGTVHEVPVYVESKVTCYPYPVAVDYERNRVTRVADAPPTVVLKNTKPR